MLGAERKVVQSEEDRRRIAYHEGGHAMVGMLTAGADPVRKVSIIPRGQALGVTLSAPDADRFNYEEHYLRGKIKVALGGRVAEEIVFGDVTTGAESDIQQVTQIARGMVARWGMSEAIGFVAVQRAGGRRARCMPGVGRSPRPPRSLWTREVQPDRRGGAWRSRASCSCASATDSTRSPRRCSSKETLDEAAAYAAAGIDRAAARA